MNVYFTYRVCLMCGAQVLVYWPEGLLHKYRQTRCINDACKLSNSWHSGNYFEHPNYRYRPRIGVVSESG